MSKTKALTQTTQTITAKVSPRILAELPRMFNGGIGAIFKEAFQNTYRAGAQHVRVHCDHKRRIISVSDDGCGIQDPELLIHAGATGWDEGVVVEPAGLGIFSYLNSDVIDHVTIRSAMFELKLDASVLQGADATAMSRSHQAGTKISLALAQRCEISQRGIREFVQAARAFYPFALTLTQRGLDGSTNREPIAIWETEPDFILELSVGQVSWHKDLNCARSYVEPVWAHVPVGDASSVVRSLGHAAEAHPQAKLAEAILISGFFVWRVDPASGVRPKLPDRDAIQASPALDQAAQVIVNALVEQFEREASEASIHWPDRLAARHRWGQYGHSVARYDCTANTSGDSLWFADCPEIMAAALDTLGWREVTYADFRQLPEIISTEDELSCRPHQIIFRDRVVLVIGSRSLVQTLNTFGHAVGYAEGAPIPAIRIEGLRVGPFDSEHSAETRCDLALADRIEIEGFGSVPALIPNSEWGAGWDGPRSDELQGIGLVFAGDLRTLIQTLKREDWVENVLLWWIHNGDSEFNLNNYLSRSTEVQWSDFRRDVLTIAARAFEPQLLAEIETHYELKAEVERLHIAIQESRRCLRQLERVNHPKAASQALQRAIRSLMQACNSLRVQANQYAHSLGLNEVSALG